LLHKCQHSDATALHFPGVSSVEIRWHRHCSPEGVTLKPKYLPMLIHKIFHLRQPVAEARERLRELGTFSASEKDFEVHCAKIEPEGIGRLEFKGRQGERVSADIEEVPGDDPNRILFRSVKGTVELVGIIELYPIRPNLTEAVLTVEYEALSPLKKALEAMSMALDRFLNGQLARAEGCMARARAMT
jgi:hypothetical protein